MMSREKILLTCVVGACVFVVLLLSIPEPSTDFNQFYAAGKLAGSGQLYNWDRIQQLEKLHRETAVPFGRIPFYAVVFKPLTWLPYVYARAVWTLLNAAALALFALLWPVRNRAELLMALCWSCPAAILLASGQDSAMFLLCATLGLRLLESEHDLAAGLILSLCAAKFHLALGVPVFLIAQRRWRAMAGGLGGGIVQLAISLAAEGWQWPSRLLHLSDISDFSPLPNKMPNLLGITYWIPGGAVVEAILAVMVLASVWVISKRSTLLAGATAAVTGGLLVGHHAYTYDAILFLPCIALVRELPSPKLLRYWSLFLFTPAPYALLMIDRTSMIAQALITGFALVMLASLTATVWPRPNHRRGIQFAGSPVR